MRGSDGKLCFSKKERGKVWKNYMERIMYKENYWDQNVEEEEEAVEGPVVCISREEMLEVRMEASSSRQYHLPTLSKAKTSELSLLVKSHFRWRSSSAGIGCSDFCLSVPAISK